MYADLQQYFDRLRAVGMPKKALLTLSARNTSPLYDFLEVYYDGMASRHRAMDSLREDAGFDEEFMLPVGERPSGVGQVLDWLMAHGADANQGPMVNGGAEIPLMQSVGSADPGITAYLLANGADPTRRVVEDSVSRAHRQEPNFFMEELDACLLSAGMAETVNPRYVEAVVQTAALLARHGVKEYRGIDLRLDPRARVMVADGARLPY